MSEMIDRVAKAIYEADDVWSEAFPWPVMGSKDQSPDEYRRIARAAIEAMREPTKAMRLAIAAADWQGSTDMNWDDGYRVMVDAALSPTHNPDRNEDGE